MDVEVGGRVWYMSEREFGRSCSAGLEDRGSSHGQGTQEASRGWKRQEKDSPLDLPERGTALPRP